MRKLGLIAICVLGTLSMTFATALDSNLPNQNNVQKSTDRVKELQRERIAALKSAADIETRLHQIGKASSDEVLEAKVLVYEAELEAAERDLDRVAILKGLVEVFKEYEEFVKARKQSAVGTESAVLNVQARRLEAEIRLEQAQAKNVQPGHEKPVVTSLKAQDVVIDEHFDCQICSRRHIAVRSLQRGYLEEMPVKEGQAVKQGDVMFKIAAPLHQAKLDSELAEVEIATLNLKNTEKLFQNKVVSADELALQRAKLAGAQAKAKLAQAELDMTTVRAPFDGIIDRLPEQVGSLVTENAVLTTLCDNSMMWVYFNMPQNSYLEYMSSPARDRAVEAELVLSDGRKFPQSGKIAAIEAKFDRDSGTIPFRADFPNPDALLRHGMTGNLSIRQTLRGAIVIPQQATFEMLGKRYVYVIDKDDIAHRREIVIQSELKDDFVVKQGLDLNDTIVIEGLGQIHDGEKLAYELRTP